MQDTSAIITAKKNSILLEYTIKLINFYSPVKIKIKKREIDFLLFPQFS